MYALRSSIIRNHCRLFTTPAISSPFAISEAKPHLESEPETENEHYTDTSTPPDSRYKLELIVKRLVESRRLSEIETLIKYHKENPKIIEERYLSSLIRSYGIASMFDQAVRLFNQMEQLGTPRSSYSFNALLCCFIQAKKFDQVVKLFDEMPTRYGFSPNEVSYCILVKSLVELSLHERVFMVLKELEEKNVEITTAFYSTVLDAFYKKGMIVEAQKLWKEMVQKGCPHDVSVYNARAAHLKEPGEVSKLMDEMKVEGVKPDIATYYYLSTVYFENDMAEDAYKVYQEIEKNGCVPNSAIFKNFITSLSKLGKFELAFEVFKDSVSSNLIPAASKLKYMVRGLAENSKKKEAKEVITILRDKLGPDKLKPIWKKMEVEYGLN
ncbi:Pentatricopeptide repeat-containing protein [Thalictrum thalictroides]|uniref:Pentatricopeptide repeat-containing protein n=1 Tax=Thalictrum thalictroides TaxID=46969 RepID=A0A7J6X1P1_THATH|nr:Pentatricopeptide repeat-containing protein [Thalictrum thalictroides]